MRVKFHHLQNMRQTLLPVKNPHQTSWKALAAARRDSKAPALFIQLAAPPIQLNMLQILLSQALGMHMESFHGTDVIKNVFMGLDPILMMAYHARLQASDLITSTT